MADIARRATAEALGTGLLALAVVGSGIMAQTLTGDTALALLANALATGAMLVVLISILGPISGAHFNPAVSMVTAVQRAMSAGDALVYAAAQVAGGIAGTVLAHAMFGEQLLQLSSHPRTGPGQWLSEGVATFGLVLVILSGARFHKAALPWLVGLYIVAAYWFTASTSFANPALTVARMFTDSFSGISPTDVPAFVVAQLAGAALALGVGRWLLAGNVGPEGVRR